MSSYILFDNYGDERQPSSIFDGVGGTTLSSVDNSSIRSNVADDYYDAAFNGGANVNDYSDLNVDVTKERELIDRVIDGTGADVSLSEYMRRNPGASYEDYFAFMARHSDEWAEKYLDYQLEKQSLNEQNAYTASREDTAYQRLVADLKAAGLNPAMMYGSSASPSASNSLGYLKQSEGATSRTVGNFSKLKNLLLAVLGYELNRKLSTVNTIGSTGRNITGMMKDLVSVFGALM